MNRRERSRNWWTQRWIDALEQFGWEARLRRGRSYARGGHVRSIDIKPGRVDARVQGSRPRPYVVWIKLALVSDEAWERVVEEMATQARFAALLLAGEMPATIDDLFEAVGVHLFPDPSEPLETDCSCPDWANPCKHVAAVHYVLGSELDRDPFLLFRLRGRGKDEIIAALRARRASGSAVAGLGEALPDPPPELVEPSLVELLDQYWTLGEQFDELRFSIERPRVNEAVLKRLGSPLAADEGLMARAELSRLFTTISEQAIRTALEES